MTCLEEVVNENCFLTLAQLNRELRRRLPARPNIDNLIVARTFDGMLMRVKLAHGKAPPEQTGTGPMYYKGEETAQTGLLTTR